MSEEPITWEDVSESLDAYCRLLDRLRHQQEEEKKAPDRELDPEDEIVRVVTRFMSRSNMSITRIFLGSKLWEKLISKFFFGSLPRSIEIHVAPLGHPVTVEPLNSAANPNAIVIGVFP